LAEARWRDDAEGTHGKYGRPTELAMVNGGGQQDMDQGRALEDVPNVVGHDGKGMGGQRGGKDFAVFSNGLGVYELAGCIRVACGGGLGGSEDHQLGVRRQLEEAFGVFGFCPLLRGFDDEVAEQATNFGKVGCGLVGTREARTGCRNGGHEVGCIDPHGPCDRQAAGPREGFRWGRLQRNWLGKRARGGRKPQRRGDILA
jgi:hypothetical protein